MTLRLDSFKNSEEAALPVVTSECEGKTPPVLREGERGMPEIPGSRHPAAPLDESPHEFHTRILLRLESIFLGRTS